MPGIGLPLVFKKPDCHHIYNWGEGYARGTRCVESVVRGLTDQRTVLGIPKGRCRL